MVCVVIAYETPNGTGTVHAVPLGDDLSLYGRRMLSFAGRPWPMARRLWLFDMRPCADCSRQVYDDPSGSTLDARLGSSLPALRTLPRRLHQCSGSPQGTGGTKSGSGGSRPPHALREVPDVVEPLRAAGSPRADAPHRRLVHQDATAHAEAGKPVVFWAGSIAVETPPAWAAGCLVLWVFFFPLYLRARNG